MNELDSLIKMFNDEIVYYGKSEDNPDWSKDRNLGFRDGLRYSRELLKQSKKNTED